jgi:hypothetical protein
MERKKILNDAISTADVKFVKSDVNIIMDCEGYERNK